MKSVLNLSFRYKVPLWGSLLIVATTLFISGSLMYRAYEDVRADLLASSTNLSRKLADALFIPISEDDVWRAFEIINAPLADMTVPDVLTPRSIVVLDNNLQVFVSTRPKLIPMLSGVEKLTPEYATLIGRLAKLSEPETKTIDMQDDQNILIAAPIVNDGYRTGTVIVIHSKDVLLPRFVLVAQRGGVVGLLILAILLPINWYWGQHMSRPLILIAKCMSEIDKEHRRNIDPNVYPYDDELGQLFKAYRRMLQEQENRAGLEQQVIHSERLAAVGRLAAGVAHEINNPLGGMLTTIDTLKSHGAMDTRTAKMISLIERGLFQIKETVSALLVESRIKSRNLEPQDFEDIRSLVIPQAQKKEITFDWRSNINNTLFLQANPVRQLLINLLLNAIFAAQATGSVSCCIDVHDGSLRLSVENDGKQLTEEQEAHLYEPFSPSSENGHGLGLWVTYQIVQQLGGTIGVERSEGLTRFVVVLPLSESSAA